MLYVALMTFILIASSVTMVLAVDAGHHMKKNKVITYMFLTIIGGIIFVGSQAWEWKNFIAGGYGAVTTKSGKLLQFTDAEGHRVPMNTFVVASAADRVQHESSKGLWHVKEAALQPYAMKDVVKSFAANPNLRVRTQQLTEAGEKTVLSRAESVAALNLGVRSVEGANLKENEYGHPLFADFFFFITGFHGFHVITGILINIIIFINVVLGTYERRGQYEMVEKVGLYWHFVDLVWVFVFTFFYLV